jgi:hypothetical protein
MPAGEIQIPDSLYDWVSPTCFSRQILSPAATNLVTLPLENVEWHDVGSPHRVLSTLLTAAAELPTWAKIWQEAARKLPAKETCPVLESRLSDRVTRICVI